MQEKCSSLLNKGKFHSGFLNQAEMFPLERILTDNKFKEMDVVVCRHSLGSALASVAAIKLVMFFKQISHEKLAKCITFGAPLTVDRVLQENVAKEVPHCFHHFIRIKDTVPHLLRYTQSVAPGLESIFKYMSITTFNNQNADNGFSEEGTHNTLVAIKDSYNVAVKAIDFVLSIANKGAQVASVLFPYYSPFKHVRTMFKLIGNVITAIKYKRNVYIRTGNFHFLSENDNTLFSLDRLEEIERHMEVN